MVALLKDTAPGEASEEEEAVGGGGREHGGSRASGGGGPSGHGEKRPWAKLAGFLTGLGRLRGGKAGEKTPEQNTRGSVGGGALGSMRSDEGRGALALNIPGGRKMKALSAARLVRIKRIFDRWCSFDS